MPQRGGVGISANCIETRFWPQALWHGLRMHGLRSRLPGGCTAKEGRRGGFATRRSTDTFTGRRAGLYLLLPSQRRKRRPRYARKLRGLYIPEGNTIKKWPDEISRRESFGHCECDLVGFRKEFGKHKLTTLVERFSRYTCLSRNASRHSAGVISGVGHDLALLPPTCRQSITFDRGTEFSAYPILKKTLGVESYFWAPQAPWQKGTVENTNGRLRRFLPLDTDIANTTAEKLSALVHQMNASPRKCLNYKTPAEVFQEFVTKEQGLNILAVAASHLE
jgi:IS30 family transposase